MELDNFVMELIDKELIPTLMSKKQCIEEQRYEDSANLRDKEKKCIKLIIDHLEPNIKHKYKTIESYITLFDYISGVHTKEQVIINVINNKKRINYLKSLVREWKINNIIDS